jgi:tRNA nucleotidyltransferase (CCA-adding enzyme)
VRDQLLGLPAGDRDWVVVGATPEEMAALGYKPVGRDFPVFLHPVTREEHALARTERKSGRGYRGFTVHASPEVTLEEDLRRRDLTINAMARDEDGTLVDPFGGERDLRAGILRHVGEAFAEDPVRILRVARFAARFRFRVAEETEALLAGMVASGEADHLVAERVWQELARGLAEAYPVEMLRVLERCKLLPKLLPGVRLDDALEAALGRAVAAGASLARRFAVLAWTLDEAGARALCDALRPPNDVRELALLGARHGSRIARAAAGDAASLLATLKATDAFRRKERFDEWLAVAADVDPGPQMREGGASLVRALEAAATVDAGAIAATPGDAPVPERIDRARVAAIAAALGRS